jgi:hypothetical protein
MSMAFQAAECAIDPLVSWAKGEKAWQDAVNTITKAIRRKFQRRLLVADGLHSVLLNPGGRSLLQSMASARLLPFQPMLTLIR